MQKILKFIITVTICLLVGYISGIITRTAITTWYPVLIKPVFNPPNWVFAPVWTTLFIMMGVAAGLVWQHHQKITAETKVALQFFAIQLALNALWSYLFFGLKNPGLAGLEIIILWLFIYETYLKFRAINPLSGKLLLPYLAWVGFASVLNGSIWWLNR